MSFTCCLKREAQLFLQVPHFSGLEFLGPKEASERVKGTTQQSINTTVHTSHYIVETKLTHKHTNYVM